MKTKIKFKVITILFTATFAALSFLLFQVSYATSTYTVHLSWTASTDNVAVTGYKIYRDGVQIGTSATNSYTDTGLPSDTTYTYTVSAYDATSNNSTPSSAVTVTTIAAAPSGGGGLTSTDNTNYIGGGEEAPTTTTLPTTPTNETPTVTSPTEATTLVTIPGCSGTAGFSAVTGGPCTENTGGVTTVPNYNLGTTTLKYWSEGQAVKDLQKFLNNTLNLGLAVDGILGPKTTVVIKKWQKSHGLGVDGIVGPKTKKKMMAE